MEYFNYNGKIYSNGTAVIAESNRGLRYGDGLFETMKCKHGQLHFIDEHLARLWKGMNLLEFNLPKLFTPSFLEEQILSLVKKNGHNKTARIRLTVFRGDGGLYDDIDHKPNYLLQTWALPDDSGTWNSNGLVLGVYPGIKKSTDILSNLKHNNFLPYTMAAQFAKKQKWNDAVVLNTNDRLCDTTMANIFLIKGNTVHTPALSEGCIAGIMRRNILQQLKKNDARVIECELTVEDLLNADEIFLTNSIYHIRWVQNFGDKKYSNTQTQKIYADIFPTI
ncbi:MAG: aminodeoxychorismate lyase [Ferruginibacter sp.]